MLNKSINREIDYSNVILDSIFDEVMILNKDFIIIDVNKTFCQKYGVSKEEALGCKCYKLTHGLNHICKPSECVCPLVDVIKSGNICESIHRHIKDGNEMLIELLAYPVWSSKGELRHIVKIGRDITEQKKNEEMIKKSEEKFRNLFENLPFSIFLLEPNKKIYDCNSMAELYLKKLKKELIGKDFFNLFPKSKEAIDSCDELIYNVINFDLSEIIEFEFVDHKGKSSVVEVIFSSIILSKNKLIQVLMKDITERKLVDNIIREENVKLRKIDDMKKQLTAQTSEEIKAPLNDIFDALQTLIDSYKDKLDKNAIKLLEMIKKRGKKSMDLVGRIVDISRIEAENIELKKQIESLIETISESVDETMVKIKKQNFTLNLELVEDLYSEIDKHRIKQVIKDILLYIINNLPKKSEISISLQQNNDFAEILIKNEMINLKGKEKKILFSPLIKLNPKNSFLGLYFSKEIVELHGGQISVENKGRSEGITIFLRLPITNWKDLLLHIYIFYNSGILLFDYPFVEFEKKNDSVLISGSLVGMISILKEVVQGDKFIKIIDHGDRKIIFEMDTTKQIIFALIVKEDLTIFHQKVLTLIEDFERYYQNLIENIEESCSVGENWRSLESLIEKHLR